MSFDRAASPPRHRVGSPIRWIALLRATWRQAAAIVRSRAASARLGRARAGRVAARSTTSGTRRLLVAGDSMALDWGAATNGHGIIGRIEADHPATTIVRVARGHARMRDVAAQLRAVRAALGSGPRYDVVVVIAGGNDALRWGGGRRLRRDATCIAALLQAVARHAVWLGPANASLSPLFIAPFDRWLARRLQAVVAAIAEAARRQRVPFIDFFASRDDDLFSKDPQRYYAADLLHPSDDGYAVCYERLRTAVPFESWLALPTERACDATSTAIRGPAPDFLPRPERYRTMITELTVLAWGCVLGIAQIIAAAQIGIAQYGMAWGLSSREDPTPPPKPFVGRVMRAGSNFRETFPIAAAAILVVQVGGFNDRWTAIGAVVWLVARIAHWVIYAIGIPVLRTLAFLASLAGIFMMLWPALF